jgi:hypothetical protein
MNDARTSTHGWLMKKHLAENQTLARLMSAIDARLAKVTRLPLDEQQEPLQIVHYADASQWYWSHHDYFDAFTPNVAPPGSNRFITFFFYLNDVEEGGATVFSHAGPTGYDSIRKSQLSDCSRGISVKPKKGRVAFWYNLLAGRDSVMKGIGDVKTRHGGCPPISGEKWGANR